MSYIISVFIGSGLGGVVRYLLSNSLPAFNFNKQLSYGTFIANIMAAYILGFVFYYGLSYLNFKTEYKLFLAVGFCGGLSTFSTFSLELFRCLEQGHYVYGLFFTLLHVVSSLIALILGICTFKLIFN